MNDCQCWVCVRRGFLKGPLYSEPCPNCGPSGRFRCGNRDHQKHEPAVPERETPCP
jgi:hypothetical protein